MRVATFGPSTGWLGRGIDYDGGRFTLEGYGPIPAHALLDYDRRGQIEWAYEGLREWVQRIVGINAAAAYATARATARLNQPTRKKPWPRWAVALIVVVAILIQVGVAALVFIPMMKTFDTFANDAAALQKESATRLGLQSIRAGLQEWAVDHNGLYPQPSEVSEEGLAGYVDTWPRNPYSGLGLPMTQDASPGNFTYAVSADGTSYKLVGYDGDGRPLLTLPDGQFD
jgi:hypothetical protein